MKPIISYPLYVASLVIAWLIGVGFGYYLTPEYAKDMSQKYQIMDLGQADRWIDQRYLNAMIAHHQSALVLAKQALKSSQQAEILQLAKDILTTEPELIAELYTWKKAWYQDSRPVATPVTTNLGGFDTQFDLRFLNALIAHHQSGVLMAQEIQTKSTRNEVITNAQTVANFLTNSIITLKQWRQDRYGL